MSSRNVTRRAARRYSLIESFEPRIVFDVTASLIAPLPLPSGNAVLEDLITTPLVRDLSTGNFFGYDPDGGASGTGVIFSVNPSTKTLTTSAEFAASGPDHPIDLVMDSSGNLFGLTSTSKPAPGGAMLFEITKANPSVIVPLYTFSDAALGNQPERLLVDSNQNVDVLNASGGSSQHGSILQFSSASSYSVPTTLATLPTGIGGGLEGFAISSTGTLYATVNNGLDGALLILPAGGTVSEVDFDSATSGSGATGSIYVDAQGNAFGTSTYGGTAQIGNVWEYTASTGQLSSIASFLSTDPSNSPQGGVSGDSSGNLYGTTGNANNSVFFKVDATTHAISYIALTDSALGNSPIAAPTADASGNFYLVTTAGTANVRGAIVKIGSASNGGGGGGGGGGGTDVLTPTVAKSTVPPSIVSGTKSHGTLTVSITNSGTGSSKGKGTVEIFASTDGSITGATSLNVVHPNLTLKNGKSTKVSVPLKNLALPAGTYTLLAQTTDPSGAVTRSSSGPFVTVAAPFIQLSAVVGPVTPSSVLVNHTGKFKVTLTNAGNIDSVGPATIDVGLSADGSTVAFPIKSFKANPKIKAAGKAVTLTFALKVPKDFTATGSYYPIITFTQGTTTFTTAGTTPFSII